jgi:uncharacterized protein
MKQNHSGKEYILFDVLYIELLNGGEPEGMDEGNSEAERKLVLWMLRNIGQIKGRTRFQKMVFLGQKELGLPPTFEFTMHYHGPYSWELTKTIENLIAMGYITESKEKSGDYTTYIYELSDEGKKAAKNRRIKLENEAPPRQQTMSTLEGLGKIPLSTILKYVYRRYPRNPA